MLATPPEHPAPDRFDLAVIGGGVVGAAIAGFRAAGGVHRPGAAVTAIRAEGAGFTLARAEGSAVRAARAIEVLQALAQARMVRGWAGLRPMTPDGWPAYTPSPTLPGAYVATCHAGVVLAPAHADILGPAILSGSLPEMLAPHHPRRFAAPGKAAA